MSKSLSLVLSLAGGLTLWASAAVAGKPAADTPAAKKPAGAAEAPAAPPVPASTALTLADAVNIATGESPVIAIRTEAIEGAAARARGARARRLPRLSVDASALFWNKSIEIAFDVPGAPPSDPLVVRDQLTATAGVTVTQPLSALLVIRRLVQLEDANVRANRADLDAAKLDTAAAAARGYLLVLQVEALRDLAQRTVGQIEKNLERAHTLAEVGGVVGKVDLLRIDAALAQAKQLLLETQAQARTAARALVLTIGRSGSPDITVVDQLPAEPLPPRWDEEQAVAAALAHRPELRSASARVEQAERGTDVARANLYPNVLAIGNYTHSEGNGAFAEKDAAYVGVSLSWDLWDWGVNRAGVDEARAVRKQAETARAVASDGVAFDARRLALAAATAHQSLAVARTGLTAAEEAYRIQTIFFDEGKAVTTDVLDAETEVARARSSYTLARYQYFTTLVDLAHAVGASPLESLQ